MKQTIAAFDFDNTITTCDTLLPFLYSLTPPQEKIINSIKLLPTAVGYKCGLVSNHDAKQQVLTAFLKGYPRETLQQQAISFARDKIPLWVKPEAIERIHWHKNQGHQCVIVSAGLEIYLTHWAKTLPFDHVLATRLRFDQPMVSGEMLGRNCFGQEKVNRLLALMGVKENYILYAYGDSRGDKELLALADYPFYRKLPA
jgi:phosphatidylglycerophosphatase C